MYICTIAIKVKKTHIHIFKIIVDLCIPIIHIKVLGFNVYNIICHLIILCL